jgi:hypothetical protein
MQAQGFIMHRNRRLLLLLPILLLVLLAACTSEAEDYIQGYWYRGNAHFMDQWYFEAGIFNHKTEVFHGDPLITSGHYRVLENTEDSLVLELYDIDLSFGDEIQQVNVKLDWDSDTISIRSQVYERSLP